MGLPSAEVGNLTLSGRDGGDAIGAANPLVLVIDLHMVTALGGSDGGGETAGAGADAQDVLGGLRLADLIIWVGFVADHGIQFTGAAATSVDMSHTAVETTHASADVQEAAFLGFVGGFRVSKGLPCHTDQIRLAGDQDGVGHTGVVDAADHDDGQAGDRYCQPADGGNQRGERDYQRCAGGTDEHGQRGTVIA